MYDESLIEQLVSNGHDGVKMIVDGFSDVFIFFDHLQSFANAVDSCLHDEVVFLLFTNQIYLQLANTFGQDGELSK